MYGLTILALGGIYESHVQLIYSKYQEMRAYYTLTSSATPIYVAGPHIKTRNNKIKRVSFKKYKFYIPEKVE
jgi:hypothetical protein